MSITNFKISFAGQAEGVNPRLGRLVTTDALSVVTAASYLNPFMLSQGFDVRPTDFIFVAASDGNQIYKPVFGASGAVTLTVLP